MINLDYLRERFGFIRNTIIDKEIEYHLDILNNFCLEVEATEKALNSRPEITRIKKVNRAMEVTLEGHPVFQRIADNYSKITLCEFPYDEDGIDISMLETGEEVEVIEITEGEDL